MKNQVNKKVSKLLITLLALVVMSVSCVVLAACNKDCAHTNLTAQPDTATCTAGGFITYTCSDCGYTFMTATPAKNHTYGEAEKVAATCTTDGYTESVCSVCGYTDRKNIVKATGHTPKETITEATCTATGSKVTVCETCDAILSVETLPALSHNYTKTSEVAATCGKDGYSVWTCSVCGAEKTEAGESATGEHSYVTESEVAATCQSMGYRVEVCSVCGKEHTVVLDKLEHAYGDPVTHQATCTEYAYKSQTCANCGDVKVYDVGTELAEHDYVVESELEATCAQPGQKVEKCTVCGDKKTTFTPAKAHEYDDDDYVTIEPTCTEAGYIIKKCLNCGENVNIPRGEALGHAYENGEVLGTIAPTCTTAGYQLVKCERCDSTVMTNFVNALGHSYSAVEVVAATCTTEGYTIERCANCDNEIRTNPVAATGHHMEVVDEREATCTVDGFKNMVCADCGLKSTEVVRAAHTWDTEVTIENATCVAPEYRYYVCTVCGAAGEKQAFGEPLSTTGEHTFEQNVLKEANCYQTGLAERTCTVCGYSDTVELPLTVHTYHIADAVANGTIADLEANYPTLYAKYLDNGAEYYCSVTSASCTVSGSTIKKCDYCEARYQDNTVAAIGHYFQSVTQEATCYSGGYTVMRCTRPGCNVELGDRTAETPALPHKMTLTVTYTTAAEVTETKELYYNAETGKLYNDAALTDEFTATCNVFAIEGEAKYAFRCDTCKADKGTKLYVNRTFDMEDTSGNRLYNVTVEEVAETTVESTAHNYSNDYNTTDSTITCIGESELIYYCTLCDAADRKFNANEEYMVVTHPNLYHEVIEQVTSDASCVADATYTYVCNRCGITIQAGDKVNKEAMQGRDLYIMTVYTGAEGYDPATDDSEFVEVTAEMFASAKQGHNWDVTEGAEYVVLDAKTLETGAIVERNCATTEKLILAIKCSRCGTLENSHNDVEANDVVAVGTIDENTITRYEIENVKHGVYEVAVSEEGVPAIAWTNVTAYYYNAAGSIVTYKVGAEGYEEFLATAGDATITQIVLNATEGENACASYVCSVCGETVAEQHLGNVTDEVVGCRTKQDCVFCQMNLKTFTHVVPEYTCYSAMGDNYYYCESCMNIYEEDPTYTPVALGLLTPHTAVTKEVVTEATCTTAGTYKFVCDCGKELAAGEHYMNEGVDTVLTAEDLVIPATGHTIEGVLVAEATCEESGSYKLHCTVCDQDLAAAEYALTELAGVEIEAVRTAITAAEAAGETTLTVTEEMLTIAAIGHDYQPGEVIAPTCTEDGYTIYVCTHDNSHTENRDTVAALGHDFVLDAESEETFAATCTEPGNNHYYCQREGCTVTKDEVVEATGHNLVIEVSATSFNCLFGREVTKFTCANEGCNYINEWFAGVETVNGAKYQQKVLDVLGNIELTAEQRALLTPTALVGAHDYKTFDTASSENGAFVMPTETTKGSANWTCAICGSREYIRDSVTLEQYNDPNINVGLIKATVIVNGATVTAANMYTYVEATGTEEAYYKLSAEYVAAVMANFVDTETYNVTLNNAEVVVVAYADMQAYLEGLKFNTTDETKLVIAKVVV